MKKIIATRLIALSVALSVLAGSIAISAPAQAVQGSHVYYGYSVDATKRVTTRTVGGSTIFQAWNTVVSNVYRVCPQSSSYRLEYWAPNGAYGLLGYGTCIYPSQVGTYTIGLRN